MYYGSHTGPIAELPNVSIDKFSGENCSSTCFFLSHCHADHMEGLNSNFFKFLKENEGYYLYCSSISFLILKFKIPGFEEDYVKILDDVTFIEVPGSEKTNYNSYSLTVTPVPAGHSPGSIMFLLETKNKTILFTGDFRILKNDLHKFKQLKNKVIDKLYYDATFESEDYWEFPERKVSVECAKAIILDQFKKNPETHIWITTGAEFGYENVLIELAKEFSCKIHVENQYYDIFSHIPEIGRKLTVNENDTHIHFIFHKNNSSIKKSETVPHFELRLAAQKFKQLKGFYTSDIVYVESNDKYYVCYATHSSCSEIKEFIGYIKPKGHKSIAPTIGLT